MVADRLLVTQTVDQRMQSSADRTAGSRNWKDKMVQSRGRKTGAFGRTRPPALAHRPLPSCSLQLHSTHLPSRLFSSFWLELWNGVKKINDMATWDKNYLPYSRFCFGFGMF